VAVKKPVDRVVPDGQPKPQETPTDNGEFKDGKPSSSRDKIEYYSQKTINIRNVVEDFNKTLAAIGAPQEINEEVQAYIKLVNTQSVKEKPSPKIIRSNLKNAAGILDEYITDTLNKPSKVVTDWIDALLLQKIEYKTDSLPELPLATPQAVPEAVSEKISEQTPVIEPKNPELVSKYRQAEKLTDVGKFRKAIVTYDKLLDEVKNSGDKGLETKIYLDKAFIYDINRNYPKALENYNEAAKLSADTGNHKIRALAHYNMASIYDEFGNTDLAIQHYYEALSSDGQEENLKGQTTTLNDIGNIFSAVRQYRQALEHYQTGVSLTRETRDIEGRGYLFSNIAGVFKETGKDDKALKYYKKSIQCDMKVGNLEGYSINYLNSADIMSRNNHLEKADRLYKKSLAAAQKLGDSGLSNRILAKIEDNSLAY